MRRGAGQAPGQDGGLLPAGLDESGSAAGVLGAVADGVHAGVGGREAVVHDDAVLDLDTGVLGQFDVAAHPGGDHQGVAGQHAAVVQFQAGARNPAGGHPPGVHGHAQGGVAFGQDARGGLVDLAAHDPGRGLHHRHAHAASDQAAGGLQAQDAPAQDHHGGARAGQGEQSLAVVQVAQGRHPVAGRAVGSGDPGDRWEGGARPGGQDEFVVGQRAAVVQGDGAPLGVQGGGGGAGAHGDAGGVGDGQADLLGGVVPGDHAREQDPVVGGVVLGADHAHADPFSVGVQACGLLGEAGADHPVAHDHDLTRGRALHGAQLLPPGVCVSSGSSRTALTLNSGMRLVGSSAGFVRLLADWAPA